MIAVKQALLRIVCGLALAGSTVSAQLTLAPGFQSSLVASGIPGARHQIAVESSGTIWVGEAGITPGFGPGALHRISASGIVTTNVIAFLACPGQMLRNPADGLVWLVHHWSGALDHNYLMRIEANGTATITIDVLWGVGHGLALDGNGVFHMGTSASPFNPPTIYAIPNPPGSANEIPWHPGVADNGHLATADGNAALVASALPGPGTVTRVEPGQPLQTVFSYVPQATGTQVTVRGLIRNPFGGGWLVSIVEAGPAPATPLGSLHYVGPGGAFVVATWNAPPGSGDFAINDDGAGGLLLVEGGAVYRITTATPPVPPGTLTAPATATQGTSLSLSIAGRPISIAPFILAADLPLGPPQFPSGVLPIPPFGVVHTSLGLLTTFVVLEDGLPVFAASPTGSGFLPASGQRTLGYVVPPIVTGFTLVLQAYILDSVAPNGLFWITNPAFLTLLP